jgi:hypothetical protein
VDLKGQFETLDLSTIDEMLRVGREEDVRLDFKTVSAGDLSKRDDRRNLAIAVTGFANSSGGIIVWGIDARRDHAGIDRAVEAVEITTLPLFANRLADLSASCASPPVDGVLHKAIPRSGDKGFAATFVPESHSAPHMAKLGEDRYYKRNSSRFYTLEHFDLEDMFGRRPRPSLKLHVEIRLRPGDDPHEELYLSLLNDGRAVAKHAGLHCNLPEGTTVAGTSGSIQNASALNRGRPTISYANNISVLHPNGIRYSLGHAIIKRPNKGETLEIEGTIFCEHMPAQAFKGSITPDLD